jgi:hypothetical protein
MVRYHFAFKSSYQGNHDYAVYDRQTGETHRLSLGRTDQPDGTVAGRAWRLPTELVDAFNAWRAERYGQPSELVGAWWDGAWQIEEAA